jgi:hypothetical protein
LAKRIYVVESLLVELITAWPCIEDAILDLVCPPNSAGGPRPSILSSIFPPAHVNVVYSEPNPLSDSATKLGPFVDALCPLDRKVIPRPNLHDLWPTAAIRGNCDDLSQPQQQPSVPSPITLSAMSRTLSQADVDGGADFEATPAISLEQLSRPEGQKAQPPLSTADLPSPTPEKLSPPPKVQPVTPKTFYFGPSSGLRKPCEAVPNNPFPAMHSEGGASLVSQNTWNELQDLYLTYIDPVFPMVEFDLVQRSWMLDCVSDGPDLPSSLKNAMAAVTCPYLSSTTTERREWLGATFASAAASPIWVKLQAGLPLHIEDVQALLLLGVMHWSRGSWYGARIHIGKLSEHGCVEPDSNDGMDAGLAINGAVESGLSSSLDFTNTWAALSVADVLLSSQLGLTSIMPAAELRRVRVSNPAGQREYGLWKPESPFLLTTQYGSSASITFSSLSNSDNRTVATQSRSLSTFGELLELCKLFGPTLSFLNGTKPAETDYIKVEKALSSVLSQFSSLSEGEPPPTQHGYGVRAIFFSFILILLDFLR